MNEHGDNTSVAKPASMPVEQGSREGAGCVQDFDTSVYTKIRNVEISTGPDAVIGSFHRALKGCVERGISSDEVAGAIASFQLSPTITAHSTEAKRVTILENHRLIYMTLVELETIQLTPFERARLMGKLRNAIAILWMTGELRLERPTLDEEVSWGLHFFNETLIEGTKEIRDRLADALCSHYPDLSMEIPAFLKYRSWIGGDRDGDPSITADKTRRTLRRHVDNTILRYLDELEKLVRILSISEHVRSPDDLFRQHLMNHLQATGQSEEIIARNPHEPFRQFCVACATRLRASISDASTQGVPYNSPDEFNNDLQVLEKALRQIGADGIATSEIASLRYLVSCFGFRTAALDIRQNAHVINQTVTQLGGNPDRLDDDLAHDAKRDFHSIEAGSESAEVIALFKLFGEGSSDPEAIGSFVLSMTSCARDIKAVEWLAEATGVKAQFPPIVPLFETLENLGKAPQILDELLSVPRYRAALTDAAGVMEIMLGYAEVKKGGGHLCSIWALYKAQSAIGEICKKHDIAVRFFHGRGGSISRGGASTGRAIAAQPAGAIQGRLRLLEQGEVVSAKYSNLGTTRIYLELLSTGTLSHTLKGVTTNEASSDLKGAEVMETLSENSLVAYRELVEMPGFMDYFLQASPVRELSLLRTGAPPSSRLGAGGLDDLRAYPWVFAWSQNRHLINGWYGFGSALDAQIKADGVGALQALFADLKVFQIVVDEVEKSLHQTDLDIAARYANLVEDENTRQQIFEKISAEYALTVKHVLAVTSQSQVAERFPGFCRHIDEAAPLIERCNAWQLSVLRRYRADPSQPWNHAPLLLSMHCISTGLGWTG